VDTASAEAIETDTRSPEDFRASNCLEKRRQTIWEFTVQMCIPKLLNAFFFTIFGARLPRQLLVCVSSFRQKFLPSQCGLDRADKVLFADRLAQESHRTRLR
jgi:hypothetical protein